MNISIQVKQAPTSRPLAGKVALVTGATSGIWLGIARAFAEAGAAVVLNGLGNAADIDRTRQQIAADSRCFSPARRRRPLPALRFRSTAAGPRIERSPPT